MDKFSNKNILISYWKSIIILLIIIYLSFTPSYKFNPIPQFTHIDKITHFLMYLVISIIIFRDFYRSKTSKKYAVFICLIFPILLGGLIEVFQELFTSTRSGSWADWIADILGAAIGYVISLKSSKLKIH